jgi:hypothetical protein
VCCLNNRQVLTLIAQDLGSYYNALAIAQDLGMFNHDCIINRQIRHKALEYLLSAHYLGSIAQELGNLARISTKREQNVNRPHPKKTTCVYIYKRGMTYN